MEKVQDTQKRHRSVSFTSHP